jgi:hypothetical protein
MSSATRPLTTSIVASNSACWGRLTVKLPRGGTGAKLKASTPSALAVTAAQGVDHSAANADINTRIRAKLARSSVFSRSASSAAPASQMARAQAPRRGRGGTAVGAVCGMARS